MGRKRISASLQTRIVTLRARGLSVEAIWQDVRDPDTERPDRRTVARYVQKYDALSESAKDLDRPWEWPEMPEGVPLEAGRVLADIWVTWSIMNEKYGHQIVFTRRIAKWAWAVYCIASDESAKFIAEQASQLATAEMARDVLGVELDTTQIRLSLMIRPHEEGDRLRLWHRLDEKGLVTKSDELEVLEASKQLYPEDESISKTLHALKQLPAAPEIWEEQRREVLKRRDEGSRDAPTKPRIGLGTLTELLLKGGTINLKNYLGPPFTVVSVKGKNPPRRERR